MLDMKVKADTEYKIVKIEISCPLAKEILSWAEEETEQWVKLGKGVRDNILRNNDVNSLVTGYAGKKA